MSHDTLHPFHAMMEGVAAHWQRHRAGTQMTLGVLIATLNALPPATRVPDLGSPHSYRGYYCDLALELSSDGTRPAHDLLDDCRSVMGHSLEGYKGGAYLMGEHTPVWVSNYGDASGQRLLSLLPFTTAPEPTDAPAL